MDIDADGRVRREVEEDGGREGLGPELDIDTADRPGDVALEDVGSVGEGERQPACRVALRDDRRARRRDPCPVAIDDGRLQRVGHALVDRDVAVVEQERDGDLGRLVDDLTRDDGTRTRLAGALDEDDVGMRVG